MSGNWMGEDEENDNQFIGKLHIHQTLRDLDISTEESKMGSYHQWKEKINTAEEKSSVARKIISKLKKRYII